ncbi:hypothetical protein [Streptosporangium sp. NPDC048865]|uniref:hypothetical protein n=1 Tax=Streptosporangium sp. NPDC048865 TaxID=3155766 RepID=UPI00342CBF28
MPSTALCMRSSPVRQGGVSSSGSASRSATLPRSGMSRSCPLRRDEDALLLAAEQVGLSWR